MKQTVTATLTAAFGRSYELALDDGRIVSGFPRGKKSVYACGDRVEVELSSVDQGVIAELHPRTSLLYRSDAWKEKLIAANATQIIIVVATEPDFSDELISRTLVAAHSQQLSALVVVNKADLADKLVATRAFLAPFAQTGACFIELSALMDVSALLPHLNGHTSVLVGQSGMGKSTLTNALVPEAKAATREISEALGTGKHTTTGSRLYRLPGGGSLIDCPGLQAFGLAHLSIDEIASGFAEFVPHLGQCRFRDCKHDAEPDCAIRGAVARGEISERRLAHFHAIRHELEFAQVNYRH